MKTTYAWTLIDMDGTILTDHNGYWMIFKTREHARTMRQTGERIRKVRIADLGRE